MSETANQCVDTAERVNKIAREDRKIVQGFGRLAGSASMVHYELLAKPIASVGYICERTRLVPNTVSKAFASLAEAGIAREITGKKPDRSCHDTKNAKTKRFLVIEGWVGKWWRKSAMNQPLFPE